MIEDIVEIEQLLNRYCQAGLTAERTYSLGEARELS